ncbi:unnamed protein product, partial [Musa acuminata var. zebrina]
MREFIIEVASLGRMRHGHLVQLKGWSKRKEELNLVYEYMPNDSLDAFLFSHGRRGQLSWSERFKILKGIAWGFLYKELNEEDRKIKNRSRLRCTKMNARSGDFGLASGDCDISRWSRLMEAMDRRLGGHYGKEEAEMVLNLGLVCCRSTAEVIFELCQAVQPLDPGIPGINNDVSLVFSEADPLDLISGMSITSS